MGRFLQALSYLLPPGAAWPRELGSTWMRVLAGLAAMFQDQAEHADQTVREWQPHTTHTRLAEWEEALDLPNRCFDLARPYADRQAAVLARLRGTPGAYDDSSPCAPAAIEQMCATLGVPVVVRYNVPFRAGRNRVGQRLGRRDGRLWVLVQDISPVAWIKLPDGNLLKLGNKMLTLPVDPHAAQISAEQLACALERVVPARFTFSVVPH